MDLRDILQILALAATILGVPIALFLYYNTKRKERLDREYGIYDSLDDKYVEYLQLCLQNPDLDVFDTPLKERGNVTAEQERREVIIFAVLFSILERAFILYQGHSARLRKEQWAGWDAFIREWTQRANFRQAWKVVEGEQFDGRFVAYMAGLFEGKDSTVPGKQAVR